MGLSENSVSLIPMVFLSLSILKQCYLWVSPIDTAVCSLGFFISFRRTPSDRLPDTPAMNLFIRLLMDVHSS